MRAAVTVRPAAFVSNGPKTGLLSFFTSRETPDNHTDHCLNAMAHCNHLHCLLNIATVMECSRKKKSRENGELLNILFH